MISEELMRNIMIVFTICLYTVVIFNFIRNQRKYETDEGYRAYIDNMCKVEESYEAMLKERKKN